MSDHDFEPPSIDTHSSSAQEKIQPAPLFGLILVGGKSVRMKVDKASLIYHGKPQAEHCLDLLKPHCQKTFLSCRQDQAHQVGFIGLPQIHDTFLDLGPLSGILSAMRAYPDTAFLVVACDLPFLDAQTLNALVAARDTSQFATAFIGPQKPKPGSDFPHTGLPEPLCAIYEPGSYGKMLELLGQRISCPRKFLLRSPVKMVTPPQIRTLLNANDPETYLEIKQQLN